LHYPRSRPRLNGGSVHDEGVIKAAKDTGLHHNLNIGSDSGPQLHRIDLLRESKVANGIAVNIATNKHYWEGLRDLATFHWSAVQWFISFSYCCGCCHDSNTT
jgi:hypothetical protein